MADAPKILGSDTLRIAYPKINKAIDNANDALTTSSSASRKADTAVNTANEANSKADATQTQLNNIILENGNSEPEVVQARGGKPVLNDRLNDFDSQLAVTVPFKPTVMGGLKRAFSGDVGTYTAWPYGCLFNDNDVLVQFYTTGSSHVANDKKVYMRRLDTLNSNSWGSPILVSDRTSEGLGATIHAAGITSDGHYLAIVRYTDDRNLIVGTRLMRSNDKGNSWYIASQWIVDGSAVQPEEAGDLFLTKNGTLLTYYRSQTGANFVTRSTDNGYTWSNRPVTNNIGNEPLEGTFTQLPDGTIVCVVRAKITGAPYTTKDKALYTISTDDGDTWSELQYTDIEDMNNSPGALIYHEEEDLVEIFYASRRAHEDDGLGSVYQSITTPELAKMGKFGTPKRIGFGSSTRDFGYPAIAKNSKGEMFLTYYNGYDPITNILMMRGSRDYTNNVKNVTPDLTNYFTGRSHVDYDGKDGISMKRVTSLAFNKVPLGSLRFGLENRFPNGNEVVAVSTVPTSTQWQTVNVSSLLGSNFDEGIGGYVIEVIYELASNLEQSIVFSYNQQTTPRGSRIIKKNSTVDPVKENRILTVPCVTSGMGLNKTTFPVGSFAYKLSDNTKFNTLQINIIGWIPSN